MRNITLCLLLTSWLGFSQPILNATDFPTSFYAIGYAANPEGFGNGASGENVVWDYSTINLTSVESAYSIVPVSECSASTIVPNANFCEKFEFNGNTTYNLYILNNQTLELVGISGSFFTNYSYNSGTIYQFPYTYASIIQDTIWPFGSPTPPEPLTRIYDGYGTLITPHATYNNVIRQKLISGFGLASYHWIGTNPYRLLMRGNFENGSDVYFYTDSTLATNQQIANKFHLYPNPTTAVFSIATPTNKNLSVKVFDVLGNQILQSDNYISNDIISLKDYASGIYIVKATDENNKLLFTGKIVKQ